MSDAGKSGDSQSTGDKRVSWGWIEQAGVDATMKIPEHPAVPLEGATPLQKDGGEGEGGEPEPVESAEVGAGGGEPRAGGDTPPDAEPASGQQSEAGPASQGSAGTPIPHTQRQPLPTPSPAPPEPELPLGDASGCPACATSTPSPTCTPAGPALQAAAPQPLSATQEGAEAAPLPPDAAPLPPPAHSQPGNDEWMRPAGDGVCTPPPPPILQGAPDPLPVRRTGRKGGGAARKAAGGGSQVMQRHYLAYDSDTERSLQRTGNEKVTSPAWCLLIPQGGRARQTVAVARAAFALVMRRVRAETAAPPPGPSVAPRTMKEKAVCRITAPSAKGEPGSLERCTSAVLLTVNRAPVPCNTQIPLSHGDEVAISTLHGVVYTYTVMMQPENLSHVLEAAGAAEKRKLFESPRGAGGGDDGSGGEPPRKRAALPKRGAKGGDGGVGQQRPRPRYAPPPDLPPPPHAPPQRREQAAQWLGEVLSSSFSQAVRFLGEPPLPYAPPLFHPHARPGYGFAAPPPGHYPMQPGHHHHPDYPTSAPPYGPADPTAGGSDPYSPPPPAGYASAGRAMYGYHSAVGYPLHPAVEERVADADPAKQRGGGGARSLWRDADFDLDGHSPAEGESEGEGEGKPVAAVNPPEPAAKPAEGVVAQQGSAVEAAPTEGSSVASASGVGSVPAVSGLAAEAAARAKSLQEAVEEELRAWAVAPSDNSVDLDAADYPYYLEASERVQIHHALYLNIAGQSNVPFLERTPQTLCLKLRGDTTPASGDVYCEMLLKGMARALGAHFLPFDPTGLRSASPTPGPLASHGLMLAPASVRGAGQKKLSDGPPSASALRQPFSSAQQEFEVGDRVIYAGPKGGSGPAEWVPCEGKDLLTKKTGEAPLVAAVDERGKVAVTFPDNAASTRVGVCFDNPQPSGTDLGGMCPQGHGLFVEQKELRPETHGSVMQALFSLANSHQPLIVYIRSSASQHLMSDVSAQHEFRTLLGQMTGRCCFVLSSNASGPAGPPPAAGKKADNFAGAVRKARRAVEKVAEMIGTARVVDAAAKQVQGGGSLFPSRISVQTMPAQKVGAMMREHVLSAWDNRLVSDKIFLRCTENVLLLQDVMTCNMLYCPELAQMCHTVKLKRLEDYDLSSMPNAELDGLGPAAKMASFTPDDAHNIVCWSAAYHLEHAVATKLAPSSIAPDQRWPVVGGPGDLASCLQLSIDDLRYGVSLYGKADKNQTDSNDDGKAKPPKSKSEGGGMAIDSESGNEYEERLMSDVMPAGSINVSFDDIGALKDVKELVQDVVLQPLLRPGLYSRSRLTLPSKGLLLFGPPGTGKTMMAKAIATSVKAAFLNISASSITSKWYGEGEKHVSAMFSLAAKLSPCIIFIDEIDSLLGKRGRKNEHESSRRIKNEIMSAWDGMRSHQQVMVVGATNRPQDLDEAVLRRLTRRLLVDLPDKACRVEILRVLLKNETLAEDVSLDDIANKATGFSGSDLKTLCSAAAMRPLKRFLAENPTPCGSKDDDMFVERERRLLQEKLDAEATISPVSQADFDAALRVVTASVDESEASMDELRKWNDTYGEQGSRNKGTHLSYYI